MNPRLTRKGSETRDAILGQALDLASEVGLEALSIGVLAKRVGLSKSGLYAHFDSKEALQCQVLDVASARFVDTVVKPAISAPRGLPRLQRLFERWLHWAEDELAGGCPFIAAAADFDDKPGLVRTHLAELLGELIATVARSAKIAVEEGDLRADLDAEQFAFELWGLVHAYHTYQRLLDQQNARERARRALRSLIERSSQPEN